MTAQQLKNSILQMAVQGKLVPQDPNDEPASVLLEKIKAEKEQLIADGKIKKPKKTSEIFRGTTRNLPYTFCEQTGKEIKDISDEIPFEIPESWEWVRCSTLGAIVRGNGIKRTETVESGMPCVRYGELYTTYNTSFTNTVSFVTKELFEQCKHISYGDILFTLTGENKPDIGKTVAYLGEKNVAVGGDLAYWTYHGMNPLYLTYVMASPYVIGRKVNLATGDIIVHISGDKVGSILIPIPPLEEQERIVSQIKKIEPMICEYDVKEQKIYNLNTTFPEMLKKSILQEAVQGKLVPQDPNDEPASVLLERIRVEKQELIKQGKIKKDKHESVIFTRDKIPYEKRDGVERCIADEVPFEIPESWEWVKLKSVALSELGKTLDKGKNKGNLKPYLCSINVYWDGINLNKVKEARFEDSELSKYQLQKGDLLICEGGDVGRCAIWENDDIIFYQNALHRVRFFGNINPYYFKYIMELYKGIGIIDEYSKGMTIKHLVQSSLNNIYFPFPPLSEQHRIVEKINELMPIISTISK
jgi:type I restriction enzyme S subunit